MRSRAIILMLLAALGGPAAAPAGLFSSGADPKPLSYEHDITPLLDKYCFACHGRGKHKGDLALDSYKTVAAVEQDRKIWELVLHHVHTQEMPPEDKPQPTQAERDRITTWIEQQLYKFDPRHPDPGRVTLHRLNRAEYNNTIRDLTGVDFQPAADFPADDSGYGFDNIGDALSLPSLLMEKYLAAAEKILDQAIPAESAGETNRVKASSRALPEPFARFPAQDPPAATRTNLARDFVGQFARRAWRRPAQAPEVERLMQLFTLATDHGDNFNASLKLPFKAILVSPHFLFRDELQPDPDNPTSIHPINEFALASRLSYFLWSSMPDEELFKLAGRGVLRKNLDSQVKRMLASPKSHALVENFAGQWLQTRSLKSFAPDKTLFPDFDEPLRAAMEEETGRFFEFVLRQDRSVLDFLNADYTFVNARLAKHYGIANVSGDQFQKVSLQGTPRRGVLTQGSVLLLTSNPTRTSPVKRGKWVLENLLGTPPPPPPPDVPVLKDDGKPLSGSLRQQMEQHRANPTCAGCHARMDPIGFGLENFDAIGAWRVKDGNFPIDPSGQLAGGEPFAGAIDLTNILAQKKRDEFVRCLAEKVLTYALGRGLEYYDRPALDQIAKQLEKDKFKFSSLMLEAAKSVPFQMRRGEGGALTKAGGG